MKVRILNLIMAKRFSYGVILLSFIIGVAVLNSAYWNPCVNSDFNFVFRYGHYHVKVKNEMNTFIGTYTKDMVTESPITVKLCLTREDLDRIYRKMMEIEFFSYPEFFNVRQTGEVLGEGSHWYTFYLRVKKGTETKTVQWNSRYVVSGNEDYDRLKELANLICEIVEAKPEYQRMPKPKSGYA